MLHGVNLPTERASVAIPADAVGVYWADILAGSSGSFMLPLLVDSAPVMDAGDNDSLRPLPGLPVAVDGVFGRSAQTKYGFHASAGVKILFDLQGRRIGSRIDGSIRVLNSTGKELATNDDSPGLGKDARLEFTAPAAGEYLVEVRNVEERTGPDCYYRLNAAEVVPDFEIAIATDRLTVPAGGTVVLPMTIERSGGFNDPVSVTMTDLPPGVICRGGYFAPGKNSIDLTLTAPPDAPFLTAAVHLIAKAAIGGKRFEHEAPGWEKYEHRSIDLLLSVEYSYTRPHHIWDLLLLAVTDRTDPITISSTTTAVTLTAGSTIEIPIHVIRHPGAVGDVKLDVRGLPGKVTASAVTIPANQTDGMLKLTAAADVGIEIGSPIVQGHLGNAVALLPAIQLTVSKK